MASFEIDTHGLDGLIDELDKLGGTEFEEAANRALTKAGERLSEYFHGALMSEIHPHHRTARGQFDNDEFWADNLVDSGDFLESVTPTAVKSDKHGKHVDVGPRRTARKGKKTVISNAELGVILEYGTRKVQPTHWMSNTVDDVAEDILDVMQDEIFKTIDKNLGGK